LNEGRREEKNRERIGSHGLSADAFLDLPKREEEKREDPHVSERGEKQKEPLCLLWGGGKIRETAPACVRIDVRKEKKIVGFF